jgi:hypothetical protein
MKNSLFRFSIFPLMLLLCFIFYCAQPGEKVDADRQDLQLDKIPKEVMDALMIKFPKAEIRQWTKEQENDLIVYDIEFRQENIKFEADIRENGVIHNWEKEITVQDLPEIVQKVVKIQYQGYLTQEIMQITDVTNGLESLEGYEIVLQTANKKNVEVTLAPDGTILEDSGGTN